MIGVEGALASPSRKESGDYRTVSAARAAHAAGSRRDYGNAIGEALNRQWIPSLNEAPGTYSRSTGSSRVSPLLEGQSEIHGAQPLGALIVSLENKYKFGKG